MFMQKAIIVCNGSLNTKFLFQHLDKSSFLIAVDGGANKLAKTSFQPDLVIGDMDSITKASKKKYKNAQFISFPKEKDKIDLELALDYCIEKKFKEILILGAVGSRADMNLTNIFLLAQIPKNINAKIVHENQEIFLLPKKTGLEGVPGEKISFLPISGEVKGLSLEGTKYELKNYGMRFGIGMGLSNEFKSKKIKISFKDGTLVCVHFRSWL